MKELVKFLFRFYPPVKIVLRRARHYEQVWDGTIEQFVESFETQGNQWVAVPRNYPQWALQLNWWANSK